MIDSCFVDSLLFINSHCRAIDLRCEPFTKLPFILYPFQEDVIARMKEQQLIYSK